VGADPIRETGRRNCSRNGPGEGGLHRIKGAAWTFRPKRDARSQGLSNDQVASLFLPVIEATEEAIYNSLFHGNTTTRRGQTVEALPIEQTIETLRKHGTLGQ
jgi:hypothetical protein